MPAFAASRPSRTPIGGYVQLPTKSSAPAVSTTSTARLYTDGTSLIASVGGGAYTALMPLSGGTFTGLVTIDSAVAPTFSIDSDAVSGTLARIRHNVSTTPTGALTGFSVDLSTNWVAGNVGHTGLNIQVPATTVAAAAGTAALVIGSDATLARVVDIDVANTSGTLAQIRYGVATVPTSTGLTGWLVDLTTNLTAATNDPPITGVDIRIGPTDAAAADGRAALAINSDATLQRVLDIDVAITSGLVAGFRWGAATTLSTDATVMLRLDGISNTTPGSPEFTGLDIRVPASTAVAVGGTGALVINSDATLARVVDIDVANLSGTLAQIRYGVATVPTLTGLTGWLVDLTTNLTAATNDPPLTGVDIRIGATDAAAAAGQAALAITSTATAARTIDVSVTNTSGVLAYIRYPSGPTTPAGALNGLVIDLQNNVAASANLLNPIQILTAAGTRADTAGEGVFSILSRVTAQRVIDVAVRNTSAATGLIAVYYDAATTLAAATTGINLDLSTNVTAGANTIIGCDMTIGASSSASTVGYRLTSTQTGAASSGISIAMSPGSAATVRGIVVTMGVNATGPAILATGQNASENICAFQNDPAAALANAILYVARSGTWSGGGNDSTRVAELLHGPTVSASATWSGQVIYINTTPVASGGATTLTMSGQLVSIVHAPTTAAGGTITDTTTGLSITMTPVSAAAVTGASITMAANATGAGLLITHNRATAAAATVALRITGADEAVCIEMTDGDTVGVSATGEGRIIYNTTSNKFQISENGGAYVNMV